jgi:lysophospholipase L1-like esterase
MMRHGHPGRVGWRLAGLILAAVLALAACRGEEAAAPDLSSEATGEVYVTMGDSVAAGSGASEPAATGYAALVRDALEDRYGNHVRLENLAVIGHTADDVIERQLPQARAILADERVTLITLTLAGNDLYAQLVHPDCIDDPASAACPLEEALERIEANLDTIFSDLHAAAGPDVPIIVTTYPNFFSIPGHSLEENAGYALGRLNEVIRECAVRHGSLVAELERAFDGLADELTHVMETPMDPHPNNAGHRLIADAVMKALELE